MWLPRRGVRPELWAELGKALLARYALTLSGEALLLIQAGKAWHRPGFRV